MLRIVGAIPMVGEGCVDSLLRRDYGRAGAGCLAVDPRRLVGGFGLAPAFVCGYVQISRWRTQAGAYA